MAVDAGLARVICSAGTQKARNAAERGLAVVSQVDGRRWSTLEGDAVVRTDPAAVADAEARYAARYRPPRVNPRRVVIEIAVRRVLGPLQSEHHPCAAPPTLSSTQPAITSAMPAAPNIVIRSP